MPEEGDNCITLLVYYYCNNSSNVPVAPVAQLVISKPSDVGTGVRISVSVFPLTKKKKNAQKVENDQIVSTQNSTSRSTRERNG